MIRYIATRVAHEKNPYSPQSEEWASYNKGFVETVVPSLPSRWEVLLMLLELSPFICVAAVILCILCAS